MGTASERGAARFALVWETRGRRFKSSRSDQYLAGKSIIQLEVRVTRDFAAMHLGPFLSPLAMFLLCSTLLDRK